MLFSSDPREGSDTMTAQKLVAARLLLLALVTTIAIAAATPAAADPPDTYDCGLLATNERGCADDESQGHREWALDPNCRLPVEAVFWTGSDWLRLAGALADDRSPCGEYWVSIPPAAADKKRLRFAQDDLIRALGIHPVAEMTLGDDTGWANWVRDGHTWYEAGVEFRRRMESAGYDIAAGETYLINEFDQTTMRDAERTDGRPWPGFRRADMRELMRGLYYGEVGMPTSAGAAEFGIAFRHQDIPFVEQYREELQGFLTDAAFWADVDRYIRWVAVENYADTRLWGVPGSSRDERRRHLEDYIFHVMELVRTGPERVETARDVLERKYLPLVNAGWRARGGDQFQWVTGHGNTIVDESTMKHFVSEQVYAVRHHAGSHPQGAPAGRLGFSWQPCNRTRADDAGPCPPFTIEFINSLDAITGRIAESIHYSYRQGGASPVGACHPPESLLDWCDGMRPGAAFTDSWSSFDWEG
jgi:hypothetical protein